MKKLPEYANTILRLKPLWNLRRKLHPNQQPNQPPNQQPSQQPSQQQPSRHR